MLWILMLRWKLQSMVLKVYYAYPYIPRICGEKNPGRLWLAYTELQGDFYMLQLIYVDSWHFTQSYLSLGWSDLHEIKNIIFCISGSD